MVKMTPMEITAAMTGTPMTVPTIIDSILYFLALEEAATAASYCPEA